jgi:type IV pilus assembly protein PilQ
MTAASSHSIDHREGPQGARRRLGRAALAALAGLAAFAAQAALAQVGPRLETVELQSQPGEQLEVRLVLDGPAPQPMAFTIDNPARLAVDLPGTTIALESRRIDVKAGGVDTIVAAEASGRTRLVFNMDQLQPYQTRVEGNTVYVTLGQGVSSMAAAAPSAQSAATAAAPASGACAPVRRTAPHGGARCAGGHGSGSAPAESAAPTA